MKPITDIDELRHIELGILKHVARFCDERGIKWFLIGGTLIGAVRHKGFVPWDDDIDIGMLRPDYERFIREYPESGVYELRSLERNTYNQPFAKVVDTRTRVKEQWSSLRNMGVWIDVFPFDGIPSSDYCPGLTKSWNRIKAIIRELNHPLLETGVSFRQWIKQLVLLPMRILALPGRLIPYGFPAVILKRIAMRHSVEDSPFIGILVWGYGLREIIPRRAFDGLDIVEFEGMKFPAMSGWDLYLSTVYGDYMTPPPPEKRKTTHPFKAWWK